MRIPDRAHWVAWRLYLSFSQHATRARPLASSSLYQSYVFLGPPRSSHQVAPGDILSRHFLASPSSSSSQSNRSVLRDVHPLLRVPYSTERDGKENVVSQGECSSNEKNNVGLKGVGGSGWSKEEVVNWPNAISVGRLLSGPLLAWMIAQGMEKPALIGLVLAGGSDWLDGYMARRQGISSVLGSYLDPLADKVLVGCVAVSMAYSGLLHPALVALIVARDGVLLVGSFVYRAYTLRWKWSGLGEFFKLGAGGVEKVEPLYISKVNMVLQLALVGTALVLPAMEIPDTYSVVPILSWSVVATTSLSWIGYAWIYLKKPVPKAVGSGVPRVPQRANIHSLRKVENPKSS